MVKVSDMIGFPIICSETQKKEGEIKDFLLNLGKNKIEYVVADCGHVIHKTKYVNYKSIYSIGSDAVVTRLKKNLKGGKFKNNIGSREYTKTFFGKEVSTNKGDILGFVNDILFEESVGRLLGLVLTNGVIDDILSGINILPIDKTFIYTKDKIIIPDLFKRDIINNVGGLKNYLN